MWRLRISSRPSNELIEKEPADAWKAYFRWHTLHSVRRSNLPKAFYDENFEFFGKTLNAGRRKRRRAGSSARR
jgi:putative endopeptidase